MRASASCARCFARSAALGGSRLRCIPIQAGCSSRRIGIDEYDDLDAYDFDRPTIIHDLNMPVPATLQHRFGLVIDGGTIEHIFDLRTSFQNMVLMTAIGGRVIHWNSASNMIDHGFWAINASMYSTSTRRTGSTGCPRRSSNRTLATRGARAPPSATNTGW